MRRVLLCAATLLLLTAGCELEFEQHCPCYRITASDTEKLGVYVIAANNTPAIDLDLVATMHHNGDTLTFFQSEVTHGYYVYADDRYIPSLPEDGGWIQAQLYSPKKKLLCTQSFFVTVDDCNCHVIRIAGPDTIRLQ